MGLFKNLRLLLSDSLLSRMTEIENRQDLLEEHTAARLDSMKAYSARVVKRERDAARSPRANDREATDAIGTPLSPAALRLLERRRRRHGVAEQAG